MMSLMSSIPIALPISGGNKEIKKIKNKQRQRATRKSVVCSCPGERMCITQSPSLVGVGGRGAKTLVN
jgi:hypothetical protein